MSPTSLRAALRAGLVAVVGTAALTGSLLAAASAAAASPEQPAVVQDESTSVQSSTMRPGDKLEPGEDVTSRNGQFTLRQQLDGNLVLSEKTGRVIWNAGTAPSWGASAHMLTNGNLVVKSSAGEQLWESGTSHEGAILHVQQDGNMTIRTPDGDVLWAVSQQGGRR